MALKLVNLPVENNTLHFIHTLGQQIPDTKKIEKGIYWGGDFDTVKKLIIEKKISVNDIRFFIGYSGWSKNQLINEINNNNWIIHNDETKICMPNLWVEPTTTSAPHSPGGVSKVKLNKSAATITPAS